VDRGLVGEQAAHRGVVAVDEQRGRDPTTGLETHEVHAGPGRQRDGDLRRRAERLRDVGQGLGAHERSSRDVRGGRTPVELAQREAVAVGRKERDLLALDLDTHRGEQRERVVPRGGDGHLGDRVRELLTVEHPDRLGHRGERRVLLDRHREQGEPARPARDLDLGAVELDVDGLVRQRARDLGKELARDQHGATLAHVRRDLRTGRDLVVEAREVQHALRVCLDPHPREHGSRRTCRQAPRRPGDSVGKDIAFHAELHSSSLRPTVVRRHRTALVRRLREAHDPTQASCTLHWAGRPGSLFAGVWNLSRGKTRHHHRSCGNCGSGPKLQVTRLIAMWRPLCGELWAAAPAVETTISCHGRPRRRRAGSTSQDRSSTAVHRLVHRCAHSSYGLVRLRLRVGPDRPGLSGSVSLDAAA